MEMPPRSTFGRPAKVSRPTKSATIPAQPGRKPSTTWTARSSNRTPFDRDLRPKYEARSPKSDDSRLRQALPLLGPVALVEETLSKAVRLRRDLKQFVIGQEIEALLQAELDRRH